MHPRGIENGLDDRRIGKKKRIYNRTLCFQIDLRVLG